MTWSLFNYPQLAGPVLRISSGSQWDISEPSVAVQRAGPLTDACEPYRFSLVGIKSTVNSSQEAESIFDLKGTRGVAEAGGGESG